MSQTAPVSLLFRRAALCCVLAGGLLIALPAVAATGERPQSTAVGPLAVRGSGPDAVRFGVDAMAPRWVARDVPGAGETLYDVDLPGFGTAGAPGAYRTPRAGAWVLVPPGTRPELRVLSENWQPAGDRRLMVQPVPVVLPGDEPGQTSVTEIIVLPGQDLPAGAEAPVRAREAFAKRGGIAAAGASLDEVTWWRGRRVARVQVQGVRHDAAGRVGAVLQGGEWEIRFVPDKAVAAPPGEHAHKATSRGDDRFAGSFLNGDRLRSTVTEAAWRGLEPPASAAAKAPLSPLATLDGTEARLAVTRTGLFRVSYSRLISRGLIPDLPVGENQLRLYQRRYLGTSGVGPYVEIEVPIHVVGAGDTFDGDDFFVFWGLRLRDDEEFTADLGEGLQVIPGAGDRHEMHNEANIYWLACAEPQAGQPWARMAVEALEPVREGDEPLTSYRRLDHIEEQGAFREHNPTTDADRMFYNWYLDTETSALINPLWAPDPAGADADLLVAVAGENNALHDIQLDLVVDDTNVRPLGVYTVRTMQQATTAYSVPASVLSGTSAKVRATGLGVNGWLFAYLNSVRLSYDALYRATGDRVTFHTGLDDGARPIEVTGFTDDDLALYDVTDPRRPKVIQLTGLNVLDDGAGGYKLSVRPVQAGAQLRFHATASFGADGVPEFNYPKSTLAEGGEDPTRVDGPAPGLVVVTHGEFAQAAQRWVDHRVARGGGDLAVKMVDVQDLYDWYSGGLRDPWAIKRFCNQAVTQWGSHALVVIGDANENELSKRVAPQAQDWSVDWVPTHYHVQQALSYTPELMATDKWYVCLEAGVSYPDEDFPDAISAPFDMMTGRLPCNSVAELDIMIDKIITVETLQAGDVWRRRGLFIADDEWSNGYGPDEAFDLTYKLSETVFGESEEDSLAHVWDQRSPTALTPDLVLLKSILDPLIPVNPENPLLRDMADTRATTAAAATPVLLQALSRGGIVAHYQGHANPYVLTSEFWMEDRRLIFGRRDVDSIGNTGKPWFFMGMGCHIADWAQNTVRLTVPNERSLGEKFLLRPSAGASAVYASSGYEFITANRLFGEYIFRRWIDAPPAGLSTAPSAGGEVRTRWVLGELMWAAEADFMAAIGLSYPYDEMLAQYVVLGDPLMRLDGGDPEVTATLVGPTDQEISGEHELTALDETNVRTVRIAARDEAGIERLEVRDDLGNDIAAQVAVAAWPAGARTDRIVDYELTVPVLPYDHALSVRVYDTAGPLPADRHWELVLRMPQTAEFYVGADVHDPESFAFEPGIPVQFSADVTSAAFLTESDDLSLISDTLVLTDVAFGLDKGRTLSLDFTAELPAGVMGDEHGVVLNINGRATEYVLQASPGEAPLAGFGRIYNFPNPMVDMTRFVFESGFGGGQGRIRVFSVAGRTVASLAYRHGGGTDVVEWDGRDERGDELANGTYLYRIEVEGQGGMLASPVQRLVIMR